MNFSPIIISALLQGIAIGGLGPAIANYKTYSPAHEAFLIIVGCVPLLISMWIRFRNTKPGKKDLVRFFAPLVLGLSAGLAVYQLM